MIGRLLRVTVWLLVGHAVAGGLFWGLLHVPESNLAMLGLTVLLTLLILVLEAAVVRGGLVLAGRDAWVPRPGDVLRAVPTTLVAIVVYAAIRYAFASMTSRYLEATGQLDAWLIATFDWTKTAGLHTAAHWTLWGLGHVVAAAIGLAIAARGLIATPTPAPSPGSSASGRSAPGRSALHGWALHTWALGPALAPLRLATIAAVLLIFVWLPWQAAWWRPASLPVSLVQPIVAGLKLLVIATVAHVGFALLAWLTVGAPVDGMPTRGASPSADPAPPPIV